MLESNEAVQKIESRKFKSILGILGDHIQKWYFAKNIDAITEDENEKT